MLARGPALAERLGVDPGSSAGCGLASRLLQRLRVDRRSVRLDLGTRDLGAAAALLETQALDGAAAELGGGETTHPSVVDRHGNAVGLTQSMERNFGVGVGVRPSRTSTAPRLNATPEGVVLYEARPPAEQREAQRRAGLIEHKVLKPYSSKVGGLNLVWRRVATGSGWGSCAWTGWRPVSRSLRAGEARLGGRAGPAQRLKNLEKSRYLGGRADQLS